MDEDIIFDPILNEWRTKDVPDVVERVIEVRSGGGAGSGGGGGSGSVSVWGDIGGTLANQTDLQAALDNKAGSLGADDNYVTDAEKVKLGNLSGTNTGDQDLSGYEVLTNKDVDGTLAANSDTKYPSQKAVKTYVDTAVTGLLDFKGTTNASGNPNYPSASKGDAYVISVAGKVGGASGKSVDIGDMYIATADNAGGTEASVGTSWSVLEHNLVGALLSSDLDTDGTLVANSDAKIATQKATKTYSDAKVSDTAYGSGWNGDTTVAPSKNAVYDKIESMSSAAPIARTRVVLTEYTNGLAAVPDGMMASSTSASGTVTYSATYGVVLTTGSSDPSGALAFIRSNATTTWRASVFDHNPRMSATFGFNTTNKSVHAFIGMGGSYSVGFAETGKRIGFQMNVSGGTPSYHALVHNGTTETKVDITTAVNNATGHSLSDPDAAHDFYWIKNGTTDVKFYYDGSLVATISSGLPSGALTSNTYLMAAYLYLNASGPATINVRSAVAEYELHS